MLITRVYIKNIVYRYIFTGLLFIYLFIKWRDIWEIW